MTALLRVAASPLDPLLAALDVARGRRTHPLGVADPLVVPDPHGWLPATALVDGSKLPALMQGPVARWGATPHAAAALAWKAYTYWLSVPVVLGWAAGRRIPLLPAGNVLVRLSDEHPYVTIGLREPLVAVPHTDPLAARPGAVPVADDRALLATLRRTLLDQHLIPLAEQTRASVRIGARTLWGALASSIGHAFALAPPSTVDDDAADLLGALGVPDLVEVGHHPDGSVRVRRRTCCLAFTVPGLGICTSCCINTTRNEQN